MGFMCSSVSGICCSLEIGFLNKGGDTMSKYSISGDMLSTLNSISGDMISTVR